MIGHVARICTKCKETKAVSEFYSTKRDGVGSKCKSCSLRLTREWRSKNAERMAAYRQEQKGTIRARQRDSYAKRVADPEKKASLREYHRQRIWGLKLKGLERLGGCCVDCGESRPEFLTFDHDNDDGGRLRKEQSRHRVRHSFYYGVSTGLVNGISIRCWDHNALKEKARVRTLDSSRLGSDAGEPLNCTKCKETKPSGRFMTQKEKKRGFSSWCRQCSSASLNQTRQDRRETALKAYGSRCACCGQTDLDRLVFDHIDGGGIAHSRLIRKPLWLWAEQNRHPDSLRALCHCCNNSLSAHGYCPHQFEVIT